jgi:hypothetical protein
VPRNGAGTALPGEQGYWSLTPARLAAAGLNRKQFDAAEQLALEKFQALRAAVSLGPRSDLGPGGIFSGGDLRVAFFVHQIRRRSAIFARDHGGKCVHPVRISSPRDFILGK